MNYTVLRILEVGAEDLRMIKARRLLHELGGVVNGPHWAKFWLCVLGICQWDILNPTPPELWLLPDWVPIAPWRWWVHTRQVFLPMSFIASKRWTYPPTDLTVELRNELFVQPYERIKFSSFRNSTHPRDNYYPKSVVLNAINSLIVNVWTPYLLSTSLKERAEAWT
jgi:lanosterol synthase